MVSMLLQIAPNSNRPLWEPSKRSLTWPSNGAQAIVLSSEEPERVRGWGFSIAWGDEVCSWKNTVDVWNQLQFTMRRGRHPRICLTTTPKPSTFLTALMKRDDIVITRGSTRDNLKNLAPSVAQTLIAKYENTRIGRQEIDAEVLSDIEGSLWTHETIEKARAPHFVPDMQRVVVAIDPSGTGGKTDGGDAVGIVVAGMGSDGRCYVLADRTIKASPESWGRRAVEAYRHFCADRIVAERNFGGAMVEHVIRSIDPNVPYREVSASRGKARRCEPVASLYEQGKISHAGNDLEQLEAQMLEMTLNGYVGEGSPDRVDALDWCLSDLMLTAQRPTFIFDGVGPRRDELEIARHAYNTDHYRRD
jgi:phage terminase large subunit-like protein